jgi:Ca2+-binding EF-hand superfamily protein
MAKQMVSREDWCRRIGPMSGEVGVSIESGSGRFQRPLSGDDIADLCAQFGVCDTDADGRLTYVEFEVLLQSVGSQLPAVRSREEFSRIDTDGNGLIDLSEFKHWWETS